MDSNTISKEEFLKFLNCSASPQKVSYTLRNQQKVLIKKQGKCTALNVTLKEASLDNKVLRIPLPRKDIKGLSTKQVRSIFSKTPKRKRLQAHTSSYGRKIKKKNLEIDAKPTYSSSSKTKIMSLRSQNKPTIIEKTVKKTNGIFTKATVNSKKGKQSLVQSGNPKQQAKSYYLSFARTKYPEDGILDYKFENLVMDIKDVLLPGPKWKIKVIVRNNKIMSIVFTNKCELERTVTFGVNSKYFHIVLDNKPIILLGAPKGVNCIADIEVLLDIVHNISPKNSMILYK